MSNWKDFFAHPRLAIAIALTLVAFMTSIFLNNTTPSDLHGVWVDSLVSQQGEIFDRSEDLTEEQFIKLEIISRSIADSIDRRNDWRTLKQMAPYVLFFCVLGLFVLYLTEYRGHEVQESAKGGDEA